MTIGYLDTLDSNNKRNICLLSRKSFEAVNRKEIKYGKQQSIVGGEPRCTHDRTVCSAWAGPGWSKAHNDGKCPFLAHGAWARTVLQRQAQGSSSFASDLLCNRCNLQDINTYQTSD